MENEAKKQDEKLQKLRNKRHRPVRSKTISIVRLSKSELERGRREYPEDTRAERPKTRGECVNGIRPCPYVSCAHHLYLDVSPKTGAIKLNFPDIEVWEMSDSCALDVADRGGAILEDVGKIMNLTRERVRQCEIRALENPAAAEAVAVLREYVDYDIQPKIAKHLPVFRNSTFARRGSKSAFIVALETEPEKTLKLLQELLNENSIKQAAKKIGSSYVTLYNVIKTRGLKTKKRPLLNAGANGLNSNESGLDVSNHIEKPE